MASECAHVSQGRGNPYADRNRKAKPCPRIVVRLQLKAQGVRATDHVLDPPRGMDLHHPESGVIKVRNGSALTLTNNNSLNFSQWCIRPFVDVFR